MGWNGDTRETDKTIGSTYYLEEDRQPNPIRLSTPTPSMMLFV